MRLFVFFLVFSSLYSFAQNQNVTVGGYVKEDHSGELLYGVAVYAPSVNKGTSTNAYGFFSLSLPEDSVDLVISYVGYRTLKIKVKPKGQEILNIVLPLLQQEEIVITGEETEKISQINQMSTVTITGAQVKDMPAFLGEKDVMKTLQLMPGVQKGTEGSSGVYVRGGGPDQNLVLLDDAPVYNVSHLFGFFSIFNGDAIKSVSLMKGGFPARYGGRLSSVIEMNMKDGNKEKIHGEAGIGLLSTRLTLEGPVKKNKSSFLISARRTYFDLLLRPFLPSNSNFGYFFYDLNAKFNYELSPKDKLYISGYFGKDKLYYKYKDDDSEEKFNLNWGNSMGTLRWNHLFSNRLFANTSLIVSNYAFKIEADNSSKSTNYNYFSSSRYKSGIFDLTAKLDFNYYPNSRHEIRFGGILTSHRFTPGAINAKEDNETLVDRKALINAVESGIYLEDNYYITEKLKANGGLRFSSFLVNGKTYTNWEPRLSLAYSINKTLSAKASYAMMNQYIHLLSNTNVGLPTDLWVPSTGIVKPQRCNQVALGIAKDIPKRNLLLSIEGYYKKMDRVVGYKEGSNYLDIEDSENMGSFRWEKNVTQGQGWSYGTEFLVQKKVGKWTGWVGYTLSWTQLQFDDVNMGRKFWARYDRRHDISVVSIFKLSPRITLSAVWVFATGNAYTFSNTVYDLPRDPALNGTTSQPYSNYTKEVSDYGQKNNYRMANYHRMDIGIQFHKDKKHYIRTWDLSIYNIYNRSNPFAYVPEYNSDNKKIEVYQISIFPILPSITYNIKF